MVLYFAGVVQYQYFSRNSYFADTMEWYTTYRLKSRYHGPNLQFEKYFLNPCLYMVHILRVKDML